MAEAQISLENGVGTITLDAPPNNMLSQPLRQSLFTALHELLDNPDVQGVVLTGSGRVFSSGIDIREAEKGPEVSPKLSDICLVIERSAKPILVALRDMALGAGLELALAAHGRIAAPGLRVGFPDLAFGLIPGAGGTQRLPRLIGAKHALALLLTSRLHPVDTDATRRLFDAIEEDPVAHAQSLVRGFPIRPTSERTDGFQDAKSYQDAISDARGATNVRALGLAAERLVDCVEAAQLLPIEAGLAFEQAAYEDCHSSDMARALLHAHFAERRALNMPELVGQSLPKITRIGVIGGGPAGAGIAISALIHGVSVLQFERTAETAQTARRRIEEELDALTHQGILPLGRSTALLQNLSQTTELSQFSRLELVIEAVAENPETKRQVFAALGAATGAGTVLATSSLLQSLAPLAEACGRPGDALAVHFHGPAHANRLAELVIDRATHSETVAKAVSLVQSLQKFAVRSGGGGGGVGERLQAALRDCLCGLVVQGVSPSTIDRALLDYGFSHAPLATMDRLGLEFCLTRTALLVRDGGRVPRGHLELLRAIIRAGRRGQAAGGGFFAWTQNGRPMDDPTLTRVIPPQTGEDRPRFTSQDIIARVIAALANEGARLLRDDIALRPSDIDTVMIHAYGFPRERGGPMKAADMMGVFETGLLLKTLMTEDEALYTPDPGFAALARNGENFSALNRVGRNRRRIPPHP